MNRENLKLLADYLAALPVDYAHFSMADYFVDMYDYTSQNPAKCGTVACAAGHGPVATGILKDKESECWADYVERVFGTRSDLRVDILHNAEYAWCFAGGWCRLDNTAQGAAKRIYWMLEHGVPVLSKLAQLMKRFIVQQNKPI